MKSNPQYLSLIALIIYSLYITPLISAGTVDYKNFELDSSPKDILFCGNDRQTYLVLTEGDSLYLSNDHGFNWRQLNDIMINTGKKELEENENEIGKVSELIQSPVDKNLVVFLGTHGINWISTDCGRTIKALNHGRKIHEFNLHPTERNWVLASAYTICEDFPNEPCKKYKELFVTKDLGENWNLLASYVVQAGWGITGEEHIKQGIPKERILLTYEPRGKGDQKHIGWNYKIDFIYSDDFFITKKIGAHKGNKFLLTENYLFVAQVVDVDEQEVMLLISDSRVKDYNFEFITLSSNKFKEHSYTFIDTTEKSVFLHVNHWGDNSKYGHIYISDITGMHYSLSLPHNVRAFDNQCDFERVNGLDGIYIANVIDNEFIKVSAEEIQREEMEDEERMDEKPHGKTKSSSSEENSYKDFIKSMISFNKGGNWDYIRAPDRDSQGKLYDCDQNCFLHLHGVSSDYTPYYSVDSAAGIILSNGNVGEYLSNDPEDISTFLSRDGGITWFEVRKGSHTYEIGDHGGLLVIADDQHPTDTILYSWDEGLQWQELRISNSKIMIKNIIIEPTSASQHFLVYGESQTRKGKKRGMVVGIDFSSLHEPQCRFPEEPDTQNSDYEKWSPSDGRPGHPCLLGQKSIYVRRKREAECYNGLNFERKTIVENCSCTEMDYECDEGFTRAGPNESCSPIDTKSHSVPVEGEIHKAPAVCNGYFSISKGYRRIPGNTCINGVKYDPIIVPCPYSGIMYYLSSFFFIVLVIALLVFVFVAFNNNFFQNISEFVRSKMEQNKNTEGSKYIDIVNCLIF